MGPLRRRGDQAAAGGRKLERGHREDTSWTQTLGDGTPGDSQGKWLQTYWNQEGIAPDGQSREVKMEPRLPWWHSR